ncbi:hypothetical protein BG004_000526 [Podila humilis]|nr:hypothetical protein BG004_000526 [Podila humilis]
MSQKLSLQNALLTLEQLQQTPSREDGVTEEQEDNMRQFGCHFIQTAGILLKLPQVAMATAQILFQRFFYLASLRKFAVRDISMGSIFLAAKVEECPCRLTDLVNVADHLCKRFQRKPLEPLALYGEGYYELKNAVVIAEMQILKKLGFNVHVQLPYAIMVNYLKVLELTEHPVIPQRAWSLLNDGLRTSVYVCYQPPTIACSVIWLAAREAGVALPTSPAWWDVLDSNLEDIENIAGQIKSLYYKELPITELPLSIDQVEPYFNNKDRPAESGEPVVDILGELDSDFEDLSLTKKLLRRKQQQQIRRDLFSILPATVHQRILALLPPFQMLAISELSRKFYNFVVLGQEMNEVWFRLVKTEEAEQKKRLDWYKLKKLEQEHRQVQMLRSFSNSSSSSCVSTSSNYGNGYGPVDEPVNIVSKQQQRLLNKKQEAITGSRPSTVKAMRRSDRKRNWCQVYVDTILRGNGDDPLEALSQVASGGAKRPIKFQTITLNESLASEHLRDTNPSQATESMSQEEARQVKTQTKIDKRIYYKSIRSKPKGKKAGQQDSGAAKIDSAVHWRQPEWTEHHDDDDEGYY